jgi:hypothetical protein
MSKAVLNKTGSVILRPELPDDHAAVFAVHAAAFARTDDRGDCFFACPAPGSSSHRSHLGRALPGSAPVRVADFAERTLAERTLPLCAGLQPPLARDLARDPHTR